MRRTSSIAWHAAAPIHILSSKAAATLTAHQVGSSPQGYACSTGRNTHVRRPCATAGRQHATTEACNSTHLLGGGLHHATPVHLAQLVHLAASTPCCNGKPLRLHSSSRAALALSTMCGWRWVSMWFASLQCAQLLPTAAVGRKTPATAGALARSWSAGRKSTSRRVRRRRRGRWRAGSVGGPAQLAADLAAQMGSA